MKILVTGGAGYIGSFMTKRLLDDGHKVVVIDSLEKGHKEALDTRADFRKGSLLDSNFLSSSVEEGIDAIIHFAAYISMAESMKSPFKYFENNTLGSLMLFEEALKKGIKKIIFSSTAGVYGDPVKTPIPEDHQRTPTNPYGESKKMVEDILKWFGEIHGLSYVSLRYFNACGASVDGSMGERHDPETHLIPSVINSILGKKEFSLFGTDYNTPDGTAVRDYIHVLDLVEAHVLALDKITNENGGYTYNVGTGIGHSNLEVVQKVEEISQEKVNLVKKERRSGDAGILIADPTAIKTELGFEPKYSDINTIVKTAWVWHKSKTEN